MKHLLSLSTPCTGAVRTPVNVHPASKPTAPAASRTPNTTVYSGGPVADVALRNPPADRSPEFQGSRWATALSKYQVSPDEGAPLLAPVTSKASRGAQLKQGEPESANFPVSTRISWSPGK